MGKRGLYPLVSKVARNEKLINMMNFITYADGKLTLDELAKTIKISKNETQNLFKFLQKRKIIDN